MKVKPGGAERQLELSPPQTAAKEAAMDGSWGKFPCTYHIFRPLGSRYYKSTEQGLVRRVARLLSLPALQHRTLHLGSATSKQQ